MWIQAKLSIKPLPFRAHLIGFKRIRKIHRIFEWMKCYKNKNKNVTDLILTENKSCTMTSCTKWSQIHWTMNENTHTQWIPRTKSRARAASQLDPDNKWKKENHHLNFIASPYHNTRSLQTHDNLKYHHGYKSVLCQCFVRTTEHRCLCCCCRRRCVEI